VNGSSIDVKYWAKNIEMFASQSVAKLLLANKIDMESERKVIQLSSLNGTISGITNGMCQPQ
jgi:hypothetical protein